MITLEELKKDYDWRAAFQEAITDDGEHPIDDVVNIVAEDPGVGDEYDWVGIFEMDHAKYEKPFAIVRAGCDYTGWD